MKRSALAVLAVLAAALLVAGCGGGSGSSSSSTAPAGGPQQATSPNAPAGSKVVACGGSGQLRAATVDCATARTTMEQWERSGSCALVKDISRNSCKVGGFRCQAANVDAGISVSCVGPEGDIAFIAKRAG
jgi:hypothetical protein